MIDDDPESAVSHTSKNTSTYTSQYNDDQDIVLNEKSTGIIGCLEAIPLPLKLLQLGIVAILGSVIIAAFLVYSASVSVQVSSAAYTAVGSKAGFFDQMQFLFLERYFTILSFSVNSTSQYDSIITSFRTKTDEVIQFFLTDSLLTSATHPAQLSSISDLKSYKSQITTARSAIDAIKKTNIPLQQKLTVIQTYDSALSNCIYTMQSLTSTLYNEYATSFTIVLEEVSQYQIAMVDFALYVLQTISLQVAAQQQIQDRFLLSSAAVFVDRSKTVVNQFSSSQYLYFQSKLAAPCASYILNVRNALVNGSLTPGQSRSLNQTLWIQNTECFIDIIDEAKTYYEWEAKNAANTANIANIILIVVILVIIVTSFVCTICNGLVVSKTIIGPWQRLNSMMDQAIAKFVPRDFLFLMKCRQITDIKLGAYAVADITILSLEFKQFAKDSSQNTSPEEQLFTLNQYFGFIGPIIRKHNGYIEKYVSNGLVAVFKKSRSAIYCALELEKSADIFNRDYQKVPNIALIMGIHGDRNSILGTMGENERMESAVISQTSSIANSVKRLTKQLKSKVLVTLNTLHMTKQTLIEVKSRYVGKYFLFNGKDIEEMQLYAVFNESDSRSQGCEKFTEAVKLVESSQPAKALELFQAIAQSGTMYDALLDQNIELCKILSSEFSSQEKFDVSLPIVLNDDNLREAFRKQLVFEMSQENLQLWTEIKKLTNVSTNDQQVEMAKKIYEDYMSKDAKYQMNFNSTTIFEFRDAVFSGKNEIDMKTIQKLLNETEFLMLDSFKRFKDSPALKQIMSKKSKSVVAE